MIRLPPSATLPRFQHNCHGEERCRHPALLLVEMASAPTSTAYRPVCCQDPRHPFPLFLGHHDERGTQHFRNWMFATTGCSAGRRQAGRHGVLLLRPCHSVKTAVWAGISHDVYFTPLPSPLLSPCLHFTLQLGSCKPLSPKPPICLDRPRGLRLSVQQDGGPTPQDRQERCHENGSRRDLRMARLCTGWLRESSPLLLANDVLD